MRLTLFALVLSIIAATAVAQEATIVLPEGNFGNYDPTLSAKDAVLANWAMAAAGIRAGEVMSGKVVDFADNGATYAQLARQAAFAQKTIVARYQAAGWIYENDPTLARLSPDNLRAMVAATQATCETGACLAERAAIRDAFANGSAELAAASTAAGAAIKSRQTVVDAVLLAEQLGVMADYLESRAWAENLPLTELGMDAAIVADRIVGTIALWGNIEPYVGITSPEIDDAINAKAQILLRTLRAETRGVERLDPDGDILAKLDAAAQDLSAEFRRAAALFSA